MLQYLFYKQWNNLKDYVNSKRIKIIGDIPIYVAADSADVWASPQNFNLDENYCAQEVAGCPPDKFSEDGQLWGNPLFDWDYMKKDNYSWWIRRIAHNMRLYDIIRIDHFRGFDSYNGIKKFLLGTLSPYPAFSRFFLCRNGIIGVKTSEMIYSDNIIQAHIMCNAPNYRRYSHLRCSRQCRCLGISAEF